MKDYINFSIDLDKWKIEDMKPITDLSTNEGVHWVPIIDAGIAIDSESGKR